MISIEYKDKLDEDDYNFIGLEFEKYAEKNGIKCDYKSFLFTAKEEDRTIGMQAGNTYYKEVHIGDIIVIEEYRNKHIGSKLIAQVEEFYRNKGFDNINLTTYGFQALDFYKKCGYELEFTRENKDNPKLNKHYLVKFF